MEMGKELMSLKDGEVYGCGGKVVRLEGHECCRHYDYYECLDRDCACNKVGMGVYEEQYCCICDLFVEGHG